MTSKIDEAVSNETVVSQNPSYKVATVQPLDGSSVALGASETEKVFLTNANSTMNLSLSYLTYKVTIPAQGAGNYNWSHINKTHVKAMRVLTNSNFELARNSNLQLYNKTVSKAILPFNKYVTRGVVKPSIFDDSHIINPAFNPPAVPAANDSLSTYIRQNGETSAVAGAGGTSASVDRGVFSDFSSQKLCVSAANTQQEYNVVIFLKDLMPHSILSLNKNFYFGSSLQLIVTLGSQNLNHWLATSVSVPATGQAALANNATLSELKLHLMEEKNRLNVKMAQEAFLNSSIHNIPFINERVRSLGQQTSASVSTDINSSWGNRVLRIYTALMNSNNNLSMAHNNENVNEVLWNSIQTSMDSNLLQDKRINFRNEAWRRLKHVLEGTSIVDEREFLVNCFWLDSMSSDSRSVEFLNEDDEESGFMLLPGRNVIYNVDLEKSNISSNMVQWVITQRKLLLGPSGASWVA